MAASRRPGRLRGKTSARKGGRTKGFILTVVDGPNQGKEYFFESTASIGRVEQNDIVLVEPGISRNHAAIRDEHGVFILEDLGSANGTRLNGEQIAEGEVLRDGDYITLSQTTMQFSSLEAARGEVTAQTLLSEIEAQATRDRTSTQEVPAGRRVKSLLGSRAGRLGLGLVLVLGLGLVGYLTLGEQTRAIIADQSETPLIYSDDDSFFNAVYGFGQYDQSHRRQVMVDFEYLGGRVTLQYGAWGVDKVGEVAILLNGQKVGQVPLTMNRWIYGLRLVMPLQGLKKGKTNQIIFQNTRNDKNKDEWEICYLQVVQEAIPPPDPKEARLQFELANKAWEDREIEPGNMYTALVGFKKSRDLLELLADKPDLYAEAVDMIEKVDKELTRKFEDGLFSAKRVEKLDGDPSKARNLLLRTRRFFRKEDFRYREIQRYLDALAES